MTFLLVDPGRIFIRDPWESEEDFIARVELARERSERNAERREAFHQRVLELTGKDATE